jgi:hypothetical protein
MCEIWAFRYFWPCTPDSRITPSLIAGHLNLAPSSRFQISTRPFRHRPAKRILPQHRLHRRRQPVCAAAEIDRARRDQRR